MAYEQGSPLWWAERLGRRLDDKGPRLRLLDDYYRGKHRLAFAQKKFRQAFGSMFSSWSDNFTGLIVDSVSERLRVDGFRMGTDSEADRDALDIWQRNFLDEDSGLAHTEAFVSAQSFVLVWADEAGEPVISVESPAEVEVVVDPAQKRRRVAALKRWTDEYGESHSTLFTPESVVRLQGRSHGPLQVISEDVNPLGVVPVVPLTNRARLNGPPSSELDPVIPIQDAINKLMIDALVASEYQAYPQRYVTGLEIHRDEDGNAIPPFDVAIDRMLQAEDPDVKFGAFPTANLQNYVGLIEAAVQHLAVISRVPFHYFLLNGGQAPSGESIISAEAGLVAKAKDRQRSFGESWEEVLRLAFAVRGDPRARAFTAETIWADPEYRTEGQHVDAALKKQALGVPLAQLHEDLGYSPAQRARFASMKAREALETTLLGQSQPAPLEEELT